MLLLAAPSAAPGYASPPHAQVPSPAGALMRPLSPMPGARAPQPQLAPQALPAAVAGAIVAPTRGPAAGYPATVPEPSAPSSAPPHRSEERRVGKGCRSRWSPHH
eukprot:TRINITY_DN34046_c0_g1_i1.p1 TRINITY_DN34046_c0_g1~~TRINITY_DN34046_c0_g1_i1.p1  ORF type:complete len:105 (-),score=12.09 TRINITY_DN34046_c0_g1_i1:17-331(-)